MQSDETPKPNIYARPADQLHNYDRKTRWEMTRRHPHYQLSWLCNRAIQTGESVGDDMIKRERCIHLMLDLIRVNPPLIDPALEFAQWAETDGTSMFLTGTVEPVTTRALAVALIRSLPVAELAFLMEVIRRALLEENAVDGDDGRLSLQRDAAAKSLQKVVSPVFDSAFDVPLFYIHLDASQRSIARDMEDQVRHWKATRGAGTTKAQPGKASEHLEVFDLREGWSGGGYDLTRERTFASIADEMKSPLATVANHYKAGFEMVVGHPYSAETWQNLFAVLKLSRLPRGNNGGPVPKGASRHTRSRSARAVPDTIVSGGRAGSDSVVAFLTSTTGFQAGVELRLDLQELLNAEWTDEEIAAELGISDASVIAAVRARPEDYGIQ